MAVSLSEPGSPPVRQKEQMGRNVAGFGGLPCIGKFLKDKQKELLCDGHSVLSPNVWLGFFFLAFNGRAELTSKVGENGSVSGASPKLICIGGSRLYPHGEEHRGTLRVSQHCN